MNRLYSPLKFECRFAQKRLTSHPSICGGCRSVQLLVMYSEGPCVVARLLLPAAAIAPFRYAAVILLIECQASFHCLFPLLRWECVLLTWSLSPALTPWRLS